MFNVTNILKSRWTEVLLIAGLFAGAEYASTYVPKGPELTSAEMSVLPIAALIVVLFSVATGLLTLGFLRTALTDPLTQHDPARLVKIGYHYFWRMAGFSIILTFIFLGLFLAVTAILYKVFYAGRPVSQLVLGICSLAVTIPLIKPAMFMPAWMIVSDCGLGEAFGRLRQSRLLLVPQMLGCVIAVWGLSIVYTSVSQYCRSNQNLCTGALVVFAFVATTLWLAAYLYAVKHTAAVYSKMIDQERSQEDSDVTRDMEVKK